MGTWQTRCCVTFKYLISPFQILCKVKSFYGTICMSIQKKRKKDFQLFFIRTANLEGFVDLTKIMVHVSLPGKKKQHNLMSKNFVRRHTV